MRVLTIIAILTVSVSESWAQAWPSARRGYSGTSMSEEKVEVRFTRWGGAILIENVMVNGQGPYRFLLDTGAEGAGRVDRSLVQALGLPNLGGQESVDLQGKKLDMTSHRLESLVVGSLSFTGVEVMSRDYNASIRGPGLRPIDGILGYHLFNEYLLTINYPARTVTVTRGELPVPDDKKILAIISDDEDPEIKIRVDGRVARALLDTGAMGPLVVPAALAKDLKFAPDPPGKTSDPASRIRTQTLDGSLNIGEIEIRNPQTGVAGSLEHSVIGVDILASLAVTYDQKNARVLVERPAERKRYGITLANRGGSPWEFKGVETGSVAAKAGLLPTDRIVALNGISFEKMDREDGLRFLDGSPLIVEVERDGARKEFRLSLD